MWNINAAKSAFDTNSATIHSATLILGRNITADLYGFRFRLVRQPRELQNY